MGRISMGTMYANTPLSPFFHTTTKKTFCHGHSINGQYIETYKALNVTVDVRNASGSFLPTCRSCGRKISDGEVAGCDENLQFHCADCIHLPEGVEVWQLEYTQRKSRRHPDGTVKRFVVHYQETVEQYQRELTAALSRPVNARKIADVIGARM